jgi:hypothetical protein
MLTMAPLAIENPWLNRGAYFSESLLHVSAVCKNGPLAPIAEKIVRLHPVERKRRVTFSDSVEIKEVMHLKDLSEDDIVSAWWTPNDYVFIKRMFKITVQIMMQGATFADDDDDFCARGLEFRTKSRAQRRHRQKQRVMKAVLRAQDFQRRDGFNDPEYIAELYAQCTEVSIKEAHSLALADRLADQQMDW